ncbi:MAG: Hpt domain-containing protein, partial [Thermacetogeniaceae bacterium]
MEMSQYMDLFLAEAKEHLDSLNQNLLVLEKEPNNTEVLNEIFRSAHTLKGMAAAMGFEKITELTHEMESALMLFKEGKIAVTANAVDILFRCLDTLESMIENIGEEEPDYDYLPLLEELRNLGCLESFKQQPLDNGEEETMRKEEAKEEKGLEFNEFEISVIDAAVKSKYLPYYIKIGLAPGTVMKSVRAFMVFRALEEYGQIIKCNPPAQDLEEEKFDDSFEVVVLTQESPEKILKSLEQISEVSVLSMQLIDADKLREKEPKQEKTALFENAEAAKKTAG